MTLNNNKLEITIDDAAQVTSIKFEGEELLYQANEGWKKQFPIIFPSLGFSKGFEYEGKSFNMPKHGFWKDLEWQSFFENGELLSVATMLNKEQFPFMMDITQRIGLDEDALYINYEITNLDGNDAFFQFGIHPAFKIDEDSFLRNVPTTKIIDLEGKLTEQEMAIQGLLINSLDFGEKYDTLIAKDTIYKKIELHNKKLQLHINYDAPHLQIWKPSNDNFVCIEPWYGENDAWYDAPADITKKDGIINLKSGTTWSATFEVKVQKNEKR